MPKTILLPEQLVTDETKLPKVIVRDEYECRDPRGNLTFGSYCFTFNECRYRINYYYKHHKRIKDDFYICIYVDANSVNFKLFNKPSNFLQHEQNA